MPSEPRRSPLFHSWFLLTVIVAGFALCLRLDARPLENVDEGLHAAVSLEMTRSGEWLVPSLAGEPYYRDPPLQQWLTMALFHARGPDLQAVRLPSAIAGILTALLIALWAWQFSHSRLVAFWSGACVATMRPVFFHAFRAGEPDGLLTLFTTAALYCWWRGGRRGATGPWAVLFGVSLGLGFMTKAAAALLPLAVVAADLLLNPARPRRWLRDLAKGVLVLLIVALPWHLFMTIAEGGAFWERYVGIEMVDRLRSPLYTGDRGAFWYVQLLPAFAFPAAAFLVPALAWGARTAWHAPRAFAPPRPLEPEVSPDAPMSLEALERAGQPLPAPAPAPAAGPEPARSDAARILLLWFVVGFVVISAVRSKLSWYALPILPPAIVLVIDFLVRARPAAGDWLASLAHAVAAGTVIAFLPRLVLDAEAFAAVRQSTIGLLLNPLLLFGAGAVLASHVALSWRARGALEPPAFGRKLGRIVLTGFLTVHFAVFARELLRPHVEAPLIALARALADEPAPCELVILDDRLGSQPAAYFELLREPDVALRFAESTDPDPLGQTAGRATYVLHATANALPAPLADRLERKRDYGDYTLSLAR